MNLFKIYLSEIKKTIFKYKNEINFNSKNELNGVIVETPPDKFDFDLDVDANYNFTSVVPEYGALVQISNKF